MGWHNLGGSCWFVSKETDDGCGMGWRTLCWDNMLVRCRLNISSAANSQILVQKVSHLTWDQLELISRLSRFHDACAIITITEVKWKVVTHSDSVSCLQHKRLQSLANQHHVSSSSDSWSYTDHLREIFCWETHVDTSWHKPSAQTGRLHRLNWHVWLNWNLGNLKAWSTPWPLYHCSRHAVPEEVLWRGR